MKLKDMKRILALVTASTLIASSLVGCSSNTNEPETNEEKLTKVLEEEVNLTADSHDVKSGELSKHETVYVYTDASGEQTKLQVNEKLNNGTDNAKIDDITTLTDIENITGDEIYTLSNDNAITWDANGNSLTYQGTSDKQIPVEIKVTYYLDGKEISPEEIAGKSGHVKMRFDFTNHQTETIVVGDKEKEVCVPFTMVTGMILPAEKFWNVQVTNGKVSEIRNDNLVLGVSLPGLSDSLNFKLDDNDISLSIPDYFEVEADTNCFEIDSIMSIASSNLLSNLDTSNINADGLIEKATELQDAADQITDGSKDLQVGTEKLSNGAKQLSDGISLLSGSVPALKEGSAKLDSGAGELLAGSEKLYSGTSALCDGVNKLNDGASKLSNGADQLATGADQAATGAAALNSGIIAYTNGVDQLAAGAASLDENMTAYASGMNQLYMAMSSGDTPFDASVSNLATGASNLNTGTQQLKASLENAMSQANSQYTTAFSGYASLTGDGSAADVSDASQMNAAVNTLISNYDTFVANGVGSDTISSIVTGLAQSHQAYMVAASTYSQLNNSGYFSGAESLASGMNALSAKVGTFNTDTPGTICTTVKTLNAKANQLQSQGSAAITSGLAELAKNSESLRNGSKQLADGTASLSAGAKDLSKGSKELATGITSVADGANQLNTGAGQLKDGLVILKDGTAKLYSGSVELENGANQLKDGADDLLEGSIELNSGAITLKDGMIQFNEEGISQITGLVGDDAKEAIDTLQAMTDLGKNYQSFAGKNDDMDGSVVFIYKIDGVKSN